MKRILNSRDPDLKDSALYGGKASNLHILACKGFNVPEFIVLAPCVFKEYLDYNKLAIDMQDSSQHRLENIRQEIINGKIPAEFVAELKDGLHDNKLAESYLAVRSSAAGEDSKESSFAGQMETFLFIKGMDEILPAIKKCWASLFSKRILAYRREKLSGGLELTVSVILQAMIRSEKAGVVFTYNAVNHNDDVVISAVFGQGEGLVSGKLDADTVVIARNGRVKQEIVAAKKLKVDLKEGGGVEIREIPPGREKDKCLTEKQIKQIMRDALRIEKLYQYPQDIEFAITGGRIYYLQTRPVTTPVNVNRIIWDNSNITESYAGVTTPLTFSFIRELYNIVYQQFARTVGVPGGVIRENEEVFQNMLGLINGEVYYNLRSWYMVIRMLPGYEQNKKFMEQMMGVKERFEERIEAATGKGILGRIAGAGQVLFIGLRILGHFLKIETSVKRFKQNFDRVYNAVKDKDFSRLPPWEIMDWYYYLRKKLVWNWQTPILTDFFAMIFYGLLKGLIIKWGIDPEGTLQNGLLCGQGDVESTLPVKEALKISLLVRKNPDYLDLFMQKDNENILTALKSKEFRPLAEAVKNYLQLYGFRGINELKLEEPSLEEQPGFLIQMIKNYLNMPEKESAGIERNEQEIRINSIKKVRQILKNKGMLLYPFRITLLGWVLKNAGRHIKNRESMRFARSKIYNVMRKIVNALGTQFEKLGLIDEAKDIYYLDINEIFDFIKGAAITQNLKALIRIRKEEFKKFREENDLKERIETRGLVYQGNEFQKKKRQAAMNGMLKGTACSPGKVKGRVKIIINPGEDQRLNGEILVTKRTDPGWVVFYPFISGLVIEKGSILSHSAIVAREMGLPAVVGITGITEVLKDGQIIEVDGAEGTVKVLEE